MKPLTLCRACLVDTVRVRLADQQRRGARVQDDLLGGAGELLARARRAARHMQPRQTYHPVPVQGQGSAFKVHTVHSRI